MFTFDRVPPWLNQKNDFALEDQAKTDDASGMDRERAVRSARSPFTQVVKILLRF